MEIQQQVLGPNQTAWLKRKVRGFRMSEREARRVMDSTKKYRELLKKETEL